MKKILPFLTFLAISCQAMGVENVPGQNESKGRLMYCDFDLYSVPVSSLTLDVPVVVNPYAVSKGENCYIVEFGIPMSLVPAGKDWMKLMTK